MGIYAIEIEDDPVNNGQQIFSKKLDEINMFGSSRLGTYRIPSSLEIYDPSTFSDDFPFHMSEKLAKFTSSDKSVASLRGHKTYELSNHLGNVLVTVSDRKKGVDDDQDGAVDFYEAEVLSASDYYPFGFGMPGRSYDQGKYRFGFNGKEHDDELKGEGNSYDFGARIYDPRIARWLSVDPLFESYPYASPYVFALNSPVKFIDPDGQYVRGAPTKSMKAFIRAMKSWEIEASRLKRPMNPRGGSGPFGKTNFLLSLIDSDYRAPKQRVSKVGGKSFSYVKSFGKYVDVGLPLDVKHFFKLASVSSKYGETASRNRGINEEFKQSKDKRQGGRTSSFSPEDLFSNELGIIFGASAEIMNEDKLSKRLETFFTEVNELFTTNDLKDGKFLTDSRVGKLRELANKYYGTDDLTTFQKNSEIYTVKNIKKINNNAFHKNFPFFNNKKDSPPPKEDELIDYEKETSNQ